MPYSILLRKAVTAAAFFLLTASAGWTGDNAQCLMCHSAPDLSKTSTDGQNISLHVDQAEFKSSIHGKQLCVDCHDDFAGQELPHKPEAKPVDCSRCHGQNGYTDSGHGHAAAGGDKDAPTCRDCHGTHNIHKSTDSKSTVYRANIPNTCAKCHTDNRIIDKHKLSTKQKVSYYQQSVHGKAVSEKGMLSAAVCTDCHGAHDIKKASDKASAINKPHIPATCGKCHSDILAKYEKSIHGQAALNGVKDAPVCTDCHGEHSVKSPSEPDSKVYPTHVVATCSKCHEDQKIARRYGLPANRLSTYMGSYHGVANKYGELTVANCATCHGAHEILPSSNPQSAVSAKNLPKTCGKCHPGAGANFAKGTIHLAPSRSKDKLIFWVRLAYGLFVGGMIASFCLYIAMDLFHRKRNNGHHLGD